MAETISKLAAAFQLQTSFPSSYQIFLHDHLLSNSFLSITLAILILLNQKCLPKLTDYILASCEKDLVNFKVVTLKWVLSRWPTDTTGGRESWPMSYSCRLGCWWIFCSNEELLCTQKEGLDAGLLVRHSAQSFCRYILGFEKSPLIRNGLRVLVFIWQWLVTGSSHPS